MGAVKGDQKVTMSRTTNSEVPYPETETISGERRRDKRYDIELELRWKLIRRRKILDNGLGHTVDLSSGGILIETDRPLPVGLNMELSIAWPVMLHNSAPLQLVVDGRIVRAKGKRVAIRMIQHQFRTIGITTDRAAVMETATRSPLPFLGGRQAAVSWDKAT